MMMEFTNFCKKNDELQKTIINSIMNANFDSIECDKYGEHPSGLNAKLLRNISDVPENRKWNVVANAAHAFTSEGSNDLAGLFPGWVEEWLEINRLWYDGEENGWE